MGVRRHRPGPPRPMGSPEAARGHPESERRRRPRQRRPAGRCCRLHPLPVPALPRYRFRGARLKGEGFQPALALPSDGKAAGRRGVRGGGPAGRGRKRAACRSLQRFLPSQSTSRAGRGGRRPPAWAPSCRGCTAGSCPRHGSSWSGLGAWPPGSGSDAAGLPRRLPSRSAGRPGWVHAAEGHADTTTHAPPPHLVAQVGAWPCGPSSTSQIPRAGNLAARGSLKTACGHRDSGGGGH